MGIHHLGLMTGSAGRAEKQLGAIRIHRDVFFANFIPFFLGYNSGLVLADLLVPALLFHFSLVLGVFFELFQSFFCLS